MNEHTMPPSRDPSSGPGYETTDASPKAIAAFAVALGLMIVFVLLLLAGTFWHYERGARQSEPRQSPLASRQVPPAPRLQVSSVAELSFLRHQEEQRQTSYAWLDEQQRIVRLPIDRAIELLAERGFVEPKGTPVPEPSP